MRRMPARVKERARRAVFDLAEVVEGEGMIGGHEHSYYSILNRSSLFNQNQFAAL